ncbi:AMP-dependent synthetase and ligase [uncultured Desulfatiglans sp.]|nr:AMP-dependent synthetase and ligase [uncultured Desulfatiglans sp.]
MRGINLATYLEQTTTAHPDKIGLIFDDRKWTFQQINENASRIASGLVELGIKKGERVTLFLPNVPEFFFWFFGVVKAGAVVNPLNVMLKQRELDYIVDDCTPRLIVTTADLVSEPLKIIEKAGDKAPKMIVIGGGQEEKAISYEKWIEGAKPDFDAVPVEKEDLAAILYTSGTTGKPKGVMLTHNNLWTNGRHCADWAETTCKDTTVCALPLFHSYALTHVMAELWFVGGTLVWLGRFDPEACLQALAKYEATAFHGVATMYYAIISHPKVDEYAAKIHLRYCVTGAAVTPEPILMAWNQKFTPLSEGYGTTEAAPVVLMNPLSGKGVQKANSCGVPIVPEIEIAIVDENSKRVGPHEVGELAIRGPNIMKGYWNKPEATAAVIKNGWFHSGDMGYLDEDGYCYIKDRKNDMIITGGFNIYPKEIEDLLYTHPAIAEVQVVGIPDLAKGEIAVACIALKAGESATEEEIIQFCRNNIANYKVPKRVHFMKELPKTVTGKLEKVSLRALLKDNA